MKNARNYHRRATECLAFAKIARDEEERRQLLNMAAILSRLAVEREKKTTATHKPKIAIRGQPC
jgi:hypothetical protein